MRVEDLVDLLLTLDLVKTVEDVTHGDYLVFAAFPLYQYLAAGKLRVEQLLNLC